MNWLIPGLIYAFFNAVVTFTNEKYKMNPSVLGMWRGFGSTIIILPVLFFVAPPMNAWFWLFAGVQGIMVGYFDFKLFSSSARFGASGTAMMSVLAILLSFILWWLIDWTRLMELVHDPKVFIPIILCLIGAVIGYTRLAGGKLDGELLRYMGPAIIILSLMTLNSKNIVDKGTLLSTTVYYVFAIGLVGGMFNLSIYLHTEKQKTWVKFKKLAFTGRSLQGGILMMVCSILLMTTKNWSMLHIPNPGYLNALALTTPVWILVLNRLTGIQTRVNKKAAIFTLICVGLLVYFADIPLPAIPY